VASTRAIADTPPRQVTQRIDETRLVVRAGNTRPEVTVANDLGRVADTLSVEHAQLLLKRPAAREAALARMIGALYDPASPQFHRWLSATQFGADFGPATEDIAAVASWLRGHGLRVNGVQPSGLVIDFSGPAGRISEAFHTELHWLAVNGARHIANDRDPQLPAALAELVEGVVSLHDFRPQPKLRPRAAYTTGQGALAVVPADLATIYNFNPLFNAGISGQGQTVVVIEDTDVFSAADWATFRATFGLTAFGSGSFSQIHPAGSSGCAPPGVQPGNQFEAELDAEWATAAAPSAAIVLAACADTTTTFGGLIALQNLVNSNAPPAIVSISYGECEPFNGAAGNAAYNAIYQQAVTEGISVFVAAGDEGAASCDAGRAKATHGISVSGFASTPYNVAVGGTDFGDVYAGSASQYWRATNSPTFGSALSYIPEIPWNDSCASVLIATTLGFSTPYGSRGLCNSGVGANFLTISAAGGGPSGCATGSPSISGVVSGTCQGYSKPAWQSVLGNPADHVRDLPDLSLFAANGVWGHYYVFCDSDVIAGGAPCTGAPSTWSGAGGTSFAAPIVAGIQALVNQQQGASQGLPTPVYYRLAAAEYGASGSPTCNSTSGNATAASCVFYNVTLGDMDVVCTGTNTCYQPSRGNGVLSTNDSLYARAYGTGIGWNFATGLGTVNVTNLVNNW
jgi:subtilase family serine protease